MNLHVLPPRTAGAAENMAIDLLLLQRYPDAGVPRFRHYEWRAPAFTFGYSQKIDFVRAQLPAGETFDLCRRPTGGGVVDHREDWTYSLVIPRGHPLEELRATQSYRVTHEALADALRAQGVDAATKKAELVDEVDADSADASHPPRPMRSVAPAEPPASALPGVCFQRAEIYDVVHARTGEKIAGAAQKRNKHGLLFQGSIWKPAATTIGIVDWDRFVEDFVARLAAALGGDAHEVPWPELNEAELDALTEQYSSPEWIALR
jgi:lipoyl(octanoyl) transferase